MRRSALVLLALAGMLLTLVVPAQAAISIGQIIQDPPNLVPPGSAGAALLVPVVVSCGALEAWNPADMGSTLTLTPTIPAGFTLEGKLAYDLPAATCQGPASTQWSQDLNFTLKAAPDTPALRPAPLHLTLATPASGTATVFNASASLNIKAGFAANVEARFVNRTAESERGQASLELRLTNRGNALTTVTVQGPPSSPKGLTFRLPAPATLAMPGSPGSAAILPILVDVATGADTETPVTFRLTISATEDRTQYGPLQTIDGRVRIGADGTEESKPSPPAPLLFAVGALAVAAWRRRVP